MKINRKNLEGKWVDWEHGVKLLLRPFPSSEGIFAPQNAKEIAEASWIRFDYCVLDWEGIEDEEGNTLECNSENKRLIFDYVEDLLSFVIVKTRQIGNEMSDELGN